MKICFLASRDWVHPEAAGGDYYLGGLAQALARRGHHVTYLASSVEGRTGWQRLNRVNVFHLPPGPLYSLRLLAKLFALRGQADVIVEEILGGKKIPSFAILSPGRNLVAAWYQRHDKIFSEEYPGGLGSLLSLGERFLAKLYRNRPIMTLSTKSAIELVQLGLDPTHVGIVPSAALMEYPRLEELPTYEQRRDAMVFIGKIRRYKRIDHAIIGLKTLAATGRILKLVIAGNVGKDEGQYLESLKQMTKELGVADRVEFRVYPGRIPTDEKVELLKSSKILLQPSPIEGFSMTSIEANACGTPVVVSDGVPKDAVLDGENGYVYTFGDLSTMSKYCANLLDDSVAWEKMSQTGLKMARRFSWDTTADAFERFIQQQGLSRWSAGTKPAPDSTGNS